MTWSRMQSKIATLMLGLALMGGNLLPPTVQPASAAESSVVSLSANTKGVRRPPCLRPGGGGRRGPCRS